MNMKNNLIKVTLIAKSKRNDVNLIEFIQIM